LPTPRLAALAALLPICVACQTAFAASAGAPPDGSGAGLFPPATRAIEVQVTESATDNLAYLVDELSDATGVVFAMTEQARNLLRQTSSGLGADVTIAPTEAWSWVEGLLHHQGFLLTVATSRPPHVLAVVPASPMGGQFQPSRSALHVPVSELASLEEHPALLVVTVLDLPHTDVRQLGNSLRALTNDPSGAQSIVPVGNSSSVILTGLGQQVVDLVRMLRWVDDQSREAYERAREAGERLEQASGQPAGSSRPGSAPPPGGGAR
jgi:hypothetical protein